MVNSVTFLESVGGEGLTVTDDANPNTGLANGGHRARLVPSFSNIVLIAANVVAQAQSAAASAAAASGGATTNATSPATATLPALDGTLTLTGIASTSTFAIGMKLAAVSTTNPTTKGIYGTVSAWTPGAGPNTGSISIIAEEVVGSGSVTGWSISLSQFGVPKSRAINTAGLATGGGDLTASRTITVPKAAGSDVRTGTDDTKATTSKSLVDSAAFVTLTDQPTIAWDTAAGYNAKVTLGANRIIGTPTGMKDGLPYILDIIQPASGGPRTITSWSATFDWGNQGPPTLSTAANKVDSVEAIYKAHTGKLHATFRAAG